MGLDRERESEIADLAERLGKPVRWSRTLEWSHPIVDGDDSRWWRGMPSGRPGEVILVMPRPYGCVLVHHKEVYPVGAFRLMSGGVENGESVKDAAHREIEEETGLRAGLARLLGVIECEFQHRELRAGYVSYVFLTDETSAPPRVTDINEKIAEFREVKWAELGQLADRLERLPDDWRDWGRWRALAHWLVVDVINQQDHTGYHSTMGE